MHELCQKKLFVERASLMLVPLKGSNPGRVPRSRETAHEVKKPDLLVATGWNLMPAGGDLDIDVLVTLYGVDGSIKEVVCHQLHEVSSCGSASITYDNLDGRGEGWREFG